MKISVFSGFTCINIRKFQFFLFIFERSFTNIRKFRFLIQRKPQLPAVLNCPIKFSTLFCNFLFLMLYSLMLNSGLEIISIGFVLLLLYFDRKYIYLDLDSPLLVFLFCLT